MLSIIQLFHLFSGTLEHRSKKNKFCYLFCDPGARKVKQVYRHSECWEWYNDFGVGTFWGICSAHKELPSLGTFIHTGVGPDSHSYHITLISGLSCDPIRANQSNSLFWKTGIGIVCSQDSWSPGLQWWGSGGWGCHGGWAGIAHRRACWSGGRDGRRQHTNAMITCGNK